MDMESLFKDLLYAKSENEINKIIVNGELNNVFNWKPYGATTGNYSSFENQQSTSEGALIEKITNSIDAILTRQCLIKGIDPESKEAPQSMQSALNNLFTDEELSTEKVILLTDGEKDNPNIVIIDDGEGQSPDDFENTLLSLQRGNKNKIKFVQGKFNMGSTGAAVFCGRHKYQLIASRRHTSLSNDKRLGFTIVRKHVRNENEKINMKNTWYEYLIIDGKIPHFELEDAILVNKSENVLTYQEGTLIKLFNYDLDKKSISYKHLRNVINSLLYYPAIPINVVEVRDFKRTNVTNIAHGNGNILKGEANRSVSEKLEYKSNHNIIKNDYFGDVIVDIYVFEEAEKETAKEYRGNMPIVFLMNGQVQYHLKTAFISSILGLKLIKDHMIVSIDCSNLSQEFLDEGLFMANRETIRQTPTTDRFIQLITDFLKNHDDLKNLNKQRASKKVTSQGTQKLISRLLGKDKQGFLKQLLTTKSLGTTTKYNEHLRKRKEVQKQKDKPIFNEFPSFFKLTNQKIDNEGNPIKILPINKLGKFKFKTDAKEDYFSRSDSPGHIQVSILDISELKQNERQSTTTVTKNQRGKNMEDNLVNYKDFFSVNISDLNNGELKISLVPNEAIVKVGNEYELKINIHDKNSTFENIVKLVIEEPAKDNKKKSKANEPLGLELPTLVQVFRDASTIKNLSRSDQEKSEYKTWSDYRWDNREGLDKIVEIKPGADEKQVISEIAINMSSPVLEQIITEEGTTGTNIEMAQENFLTTLYMQSFLITTALDQISKNNKEFGMNLEEVETLCTEIIKVIAYASVKMQLNAIKLHTN